MSHISKTTRSKQPAHTSSQAPAERNLRVVPDLQTPNFRLRRRVVGGVAAALLSLGVGGVVAAENAVTERVKDANEKVADAAPKAGEICVVTATGLAPSNMGSFQIADRFADGRRVAVMATDIDAVAQAHPGEGVAICRDPSSEELNTNHVVDPTRVPADQEVDRSTFASMGGVSEDIG